MGREWSADEPQGKAASRGRSDEESADEPHRQAASRGREEEEEIGEFGEYNYGLK